MLMLVTLPISVWMCIKIVKEYERAIIFRLGRILRGGAKGPGLFFILPCTDSFINVDMRTITFDIPPQEVLTKDSVTVSVDGVVYYRVQNATLAVANITNADAATRLLAQTTLRNVLGTKNLAEILSDREEIAHSMQSTLDDATDDWGIKVERVEIKDVKLPLQLQRAMAAEAEATREARAKFAVRKPPDLSKFEETQIHPSLPGYFQDSFTLKRLQTSLCALVVWSGSGYQLGYPTPLIAQKPEQLVHLLPGIRLVKHDHVTYVNEAITT
ncbi:hypothetical protein CHARACLAT_019609 [Characodon lateralis]|uniref:Band 7 domain-containing protein n=1 Tax=Characodon lateralis TaxID=208331 RepID=A0ABU7EB78_9TELE|nr:hypothetical protein [Characodon lateralis]